MLKLVKETLRITWDTEDDYILSIISRAEKYLGELMGYELDYETPGLAQSLFLSYCRYDFNNALEYFQENFAKEILQLQLYAGIKEKEENSDLV